jgi:hypothetical protein
MRTTRLSHLSALAGLLVTGIIAAAGADRTAPPSSGFRHRKLPGDDVKWIHFPPQNEKSGAEWGDFLTDIARHLPDKYGEHYYSDDRITHAHETTHGINSHISIHLRSGSRAHYGFYVGHDRAVLLTGPKVKLSQVADMIPESVRGSRYHLYFIDQQRYFEDHPLYLFDEWVAYTNGGHAGVELAEKNRLQMRRNDALVGPLEFSIYALGLAAAARKYDPDYVRDNQQFREFFAHELRRATGIYRRGMRLDQFRWQRRLERNLLEEEDARELRQVMLALYGNILTLEDLLGS